MIWEDFFLLGMAQPRRCKTPCFKEFQFRLMMKDRFVRVTVFEFHDSLVFRIYFLVIVHPFEHVFFNPRFLFFFNGKKLAGLNFNLPGAIWDARLSSRNAVRIWVNISNAWNYVVNYWTCMLHLEVSINLHQSSFYICCCFLHIHSCYDMLTYQNMLSRAGLGLYFFAVNACQRRPTKCHFQRRSKSWSQRSPRKNVNEPR